MKRCPECGRDYNDDSLSFCLDDGSELLFGPASMDEPATAILSGAGSTSESRTRPYISVDQPRKGIDKRFVITLVLLAALVALGGAFGYRYFVSRGGAIDSIAVLPFVNASGDKETEFLSDGISETLINNFTKIPELKVAARSTAFRFRGREGEPQVIGRELGVGSILTGRLTQRGDSVNIQVDLVNTADGLQIWGNRYEGKASDIVSIQQRIATDVSSQLKLKLTGAQAQQVARTYTENADAYQHYLRGRYYWNKRTPEGLRNGISEFEQAAGKDSNYAMAYVGLADSYVLLEEYAGAPATETLPKARAYAQKALEIDDSIGEAYASLGLIDHYSWRWADAEKNFARAIELDPNYPTAHQWFHGHLRDTGQFDRAISEARRAQELDPLSTVISTNVGMTLLGSGDSKGALEHLQKAVELHPDSWIVRLWLGAAYLKQGRGEEALAEFQKSTDMSNKTTRSLGFLGYAYATAGKRAEAIAILKELEARHAQGESFGLSIPAIHVGLDDKDQGFTWLERAFEAHNAELPRITWYPTFDSVRGDPRYRDLLNRIGYPK